MGLLVQDLRRISKWQQQSFNQACALIEYGAHEDSLVCMEHFSLDKQVPRDFQEKSLPFQMNRVAPKAQASSPRSVDLRLPLVVVKRNLSFKVIALFPHHNNNKKLTQVRIPQGTLNSD